jgi:hypothetical protein
MRDTKTNAYRTINTAKTSANRQNDAVNLRDGTIAYEKDKNSVKIKGRDPKNTDDDKFERAKQCAPQ